MNAAALRDRGRDFYLGVRTIVACGVGNFAALAFFSSFTVFLKPIASGLGVNRAAISVGPMIFIGVGSLSAPLIGMLLDTIAPRRVMLVSAMCLGSGICLLSHVHHLWQFYLIVGTLISFSVQATGPLATAKLLVNWFERRRGLALGAAGVGSSLAGLLLPILMSEQIEALGWRATYFWYGIGSLIVVIPSVFFFMVDTPEQIGARGDFGARIAPVEPPQMHTPAAGVPIWALLRNFAFWRTVVIMGIPGGIFTALITHSVPLMTDRGLGLTGAAQIASLLGAFGIVGKLTWGWLMDRMPLQRVMLLALLAQLAGVLMLGPATEFKQFAVALCLYGFGIGSIAPLQGVLVSRIFGRSMFGRALSLLSPAALPLMLALLYLGSWSHDHMGSYDVSLWIYCGFYAGTVLVVLLSAIDAPARGAVQVAT